jgi:hypothetical protein
MPQLLAHRLSELARRMPIRHVEHAILKEISRAAA